MKDNNKQTQVNEKYLDFIQATITRMGQNSFQAKTWGITIVSGLLAFMLSQSDHNLKIICIITSIVVTCLFWLLDAYYLHLERGYRALYNIAAKLVRGKTVQDYDMRIPKESCGCKKYMKALFLSPSTGFFYFVVVVGMIILLFFFFFVE